jgi:site-specific recombinase XerC
MPGHDLNNSLPEFLAELAKQGASAATIKNLRYYCEQFIGFALPAGGSLDCREITLDLVRKFARSLWDRGFTDRSMASVLAGVLRWLRWMGPEVAIPSAKEAGKIRASLLVEELRALGIARPANAELPRGGIFTKDGT